jgi:glycerol-3-phosphate O-acyltransferase/dihydroxyacetone phosphate acyltransferase
MGLLYNAMNLFAWYSTNLFFRDITLINEQNVPKDGPTIVYGNHNNQFVDGVVNL